MAFIPRRYRSLVYKLLILIPVVWLTIAFLVYSDRGGGAGGGGGAGADYDLPLAQSLRGGRRDLNEHLSGGRDPSGGREIVGGNDIMPGIDLGAGDEDIVVRPDVALPKKPTAKGKQR